MIGALIEDHYTATVAFQQIGSPSSASTAARQTALEVVSGGVDQARSWSLWVRVSNLGINNNERIFNVSENTTGIYQYGLFYVSGVNNTSSNNKLRFECFGATTSDNIWIQSENQVFRNRWAHVVITYDGSETATGMDMYINGVKETSPTRTNDASYTGAYTNSGLRFRIGHPQSGVQFGGDVRDVCMWTGKLSDADVAELYNFGKPKTPTLTTFYGTDIIAFWPMYATANCFNNATYNLTGTNLIFDKSLLSPFDDRMTMTRAEIGGTRYISFGSFANNNWYGRSGTSHVAGGNGIKYPITLSGTSSLSVAAPVDIITAANDLTAFSAGIINSGITDFYCNYNSGTSTFINAARRNSTDGLTGETFGSEATMTTTRARYGHFPPVVNGFSAGEYFTSFFEHDGGVTWTVSVFKTTDNGSSYSKIQVYDGTDNYSETSLINLGNLGGNNTLMSLSRLDESPFGLHMFISTDGGTTWGAPEATNLGGATAASNAAMCLDADGKIVVLYMDRDADLLYISRGNDPATVLADPTSFNTPQAVFASYSSDSLGLLGYPSIVHLGNNRFLIAVSAEQSSSRADLWIGIGNFYYLP